MSSKFVKNFSSYPANRQKNTNTQTDERRVKDILLSGDNNWCGFCVENGMAERRDAFAANTERRRPAMLLPAR